ncbi:MAG: NAD(P)/FAD-dependent oxidoreductase [Clostridia bacterium]|nr:NAD(P)/FAD-dependent oxidoreductase [Clostridia bacterium]
MKYDVIIIGGGVIGCSILRRLSLTNQRVLLLEKGSDVAVGASRANSGIVHAGYDAEVGTLKARLNVKGAAMFMDLHRQLEFPYVNTGSLVLANKEGLNGLYGLLNKGIINGVPDLKLLSRKELLDIEPNIADDIAFGLYAPTAGIVSPYELTVCLAENAIVNGATVNTDEEVVFIKKNADTYSVKTNRCAYSCTVLINCAGAGAADIDKLAGEKVPRMTYKRGDYYVLDESEYTKYRHPCFPLPNSNGKGILVTPTADGNILVGPTSIKVADGYCTGIGSEGLKQIRENSSKIVKGLDFRKVIRVFAGVRSGIGDDFVIESGMNPDYIKVEGINSPGLSASPAIAEYVVDELMLASSVNVVYKDDVMVYKRKPLARELPEDELHDLIKEHSEFSKVVCRCEKITEGDLDAVLNSPLPPKTLDAVKRRARAGMGRCQGGFCTLRLMELLAERYGVSIDDVTKSGEGSNVILCDIYNDPHMV